MDSQRDADKQTEPVVSLSLLPTQWEMNDVREFYDPNFDFMQGSEWLPPVTKRKKLSLSLNTGKGRMHVYYMRVLILSIVHFLPLLDLVHQHRKNS